MSPAPFRVALTGGIASGKSTVANLFAALGVPVIDTDVIAREIVEPGKAPLAAIVAEFGAGVLDASGRLDRRRMRERIFADADAKRRLDAIMHPAIRAEMERQSAAAGGPYQVLVIPLLAEGRRRDHVDRVLLVDVPEELQVQRLIMRDGVTHAQAAASLNAQATRADRLAFADDVIRNEGRADELRDAVAALDARYRGMAQS
ncbi:MAG TPA: dephospho-CoA kinase [Steroidobacteraceae bacterium]|nr:dephospho-CoA kinase [Steroidobacteraceae bacterium]